MPLCKHEYFKSPNGGVECRICSKRKKTLFKNSKKVVVVAFIVSCSVLGGTIYQLCFNKPPETVRCTSPKGLSEQQAKDGVAYCISKGAEADLTKTRWNGVRSVWCVKPMHNGDKFREMSQCVIEK